MKWLCPGCTPTRAGSPCPRCTGYTDPATATRRARYEAKLREHYWRVQSVKALASRAMDRLAS